MTEIMDENMAENVAPATPVQQNLHASLLVQQTAKTLLVVMLAITISDHSLWQKISIVKFNDEISRRL